MALPFELRVDPLPPNLSLRRPIVAALPQLGERIFFMARKLRSASLAISRTKFQTK